MPIPDMTARYVHCPDCDGAGGWTVEGAWIECGDCEGDGLVQWEPDPDTQWDRRDDA